MIGEGRFRADVARGFELLEKLSLAAYRNHWPAIDQGTTELLRSSTSYAETYNRYLTCQAYDFLLDDGSLFFFRRNPLDQTLLSYGYFESPYSGVSYSEFTSEFGDRNEAWQDYEEYCSQRPQRTHILPVRYDWSPALYREVAHPASHLHMGFESDLRLAVDAMIMPLHFVLLIIQHFYVKSWEATASRFLEVARASQSISDSEVVPAYRKGRDLLELRLVAIKHTGTRAEGKLSRPPR